MTSGKDVHLIVLDGNSHSGKSYAADLFAQEFASSNEYALYFYDFVEPAREILRDKFELSRAEYDWILNNKNKKFPRLEDKTYREALFEITNDPINDRDYISNLWCRHVNDILSKISAIPVIIATGPLNNAELIKSIKNTPSITKVHLIHMTSPNENSSWTGRNPITPHDIPKLQVEYTFINPGKNHPNSHFLTNMVAHYVQRFIINGEDTIPIPTPPRKSNQS